MVTYKIDGCDEKFRTLRNAKLHVYLAYTQKERIKELKDSSIVKFIDGEAVTATPIIVTSDGYSFGKTCKI